MHYIYVIKWKLIINIEDKKQILILVWVEKTNVM